MAILDSHRMYTIIADAMPMEGRDFAIRVTHDKEPDKLHVTLTPITPIGHAFVPILLDRLSKQMSSDSLTFGSDGTAAREVETVNTIKARIERDETAALKAKLNEMQERQKQLATAMEREDQARGNAEMTEAETTKRAEDAGAVQRLIAQQTQLKFMLEHMHEARAQISTVARAAAEADGKAGRDWSTDLNAPLTSLFDRQDATDKLKRLEMFAQQMAAHMFMVDTIKNSAAGIGKQYILPKN